MRMNVSNFLIALISSALLSACGGSKDDPIAHYASENYVENGVFAVSLSKSFSNADGYNDDVRSRFKTLNVSGATSITADLIFDSSSSLTRASGSSARLETDSGLSFIDAEGNKVYSVVKIRYDGTNFFGEGYLEKCSAGDANCVIGGYFITDALNLNLGESVSISVACNESEQKFTYTFGEKKQDIFFADIAANQEIIDFGGFVFSDYSFTYSTIRSTVRNILKQGDSGSLLLKYNSVSHDGEIYDDFNGMVSLDPNKWSSSTFEF